MNLIGQTTITTAKFVLMTLVLAIVPATGQDVGRQLPSIPSATIVDTLGAATPTTKFSVFGSSGLAILQSQFAGPEFSLTEPTTITEIGGFVNNCISIIGGVPQCPSPPPFVVQIRAAINGAPDSSSIIASFVLSNDGAPLLVSYESVQPNLLLAPGTYYALFAPQSVDSGGFLLASASSPFQYLSGLTKIGVLDPTTGNTSAEVTFGAVRILGAVFDTILQDDSNGLIFSFNSTSGDYQFTRCSDGVILHGRGQVIRRGCEIFLQDFSSLDHRVRAQIDNCQNKGSATVQVFALGRTFTITDLNTRNNTGTCQ